MICEQLIAESFRLQLSALFCIANNFRVHLSKKELMMIIFFIDKNER